MFWYHESAYSSINDWYFKLVVFWEIMVFLIMRLEMLIEYYYRPMDYKRLHENVKNFSRQQVMIFKSLNNIHNIQYWKHENWIISWQHLNIIWIPSYLNKFLALFKFNPLFKLLAAIGCLWNILHIKGIRESLLIGGKI